MNKRRPCWLVLAASMAFVAGCTGTGVEQSLMPQTTAEATAVPSVTQTQTLPTPSATATETLQPSPPTEPARTIPTGQVPTLPPDADLEIAFIQMIDRQSGWAIGGIERGRDRVLHTQDGARTFRDVTPPIGTAPAPGIARWFVSEFLDENLAWVLHFPAVLEPSPPGGAEFVIWHTRDAGVSWEQSEVVSSSVLGTQDFPPRLEFVNPDEGWFMARNGGAGMHRYPISLYRTHDGGATWERLIEAIGGSGLQSCRKTGWSFGDPTFGLATIDNCPVDGPAIERTVDGGSTWERVILPPPRQDPETVANAYCETYSPQFLTADLVLLAASCTSYSDPQVERELFYRSADGGQSWDAWEFPGGDIYFLDETRGFALSREIYWTADGGVTWELGKTVNWDGQFSFVDADYGWAVARAGSELALVATEDRGQTWHFIEPALHP
ncbi:MAG: hypothetical protein P1P76_08680 [Anaerolineales bacterium]|nr:hypothetical protein [Anaerolineales bacterium]